MTQTRRATKGFQLTSNEIDANFDGLVNGNDVSYISTFVKTLLDDATSNTFLTTLTATRSETGAGAVSTLSKLREIASVKDFTGVTGDGVADDTTGLQAAINSGVKRLLWPGGTYLVGAAGLTGASNQIWESDGTGAVTIKISANPTNGYLVFWSSKSKFSARNITFDLNGKTSAASQILAFLSCTDFSIEDCRIVSVDVFGLAINSCLRFKVHRNYIEKTTAASSQNEAIVVSSSVSTSQFGEIAFNYCKNTGMDVDGNNHKIIGNVIESWKFGAGISIEQNADTHTNIISGNHCFSGTGTDVNGLRVSGIENWGARSVIANNIFYNNSGSGIEQGGGRCVISGNVCFNNGQTAPGNAGIVSRYDSATFNASQSVYVGNRCFDTSGAGGTQTYGYLDQSALLSYITLAGNDFTGNKTGPESILGTVYDNQTPLLEGSTTWDPPNLAASGTTTQAFTVAGAVLGDFVEISFSLDLQGLQLAGYVSAANTVTAVLFNPTAGAINLASGTLRAKVRKQSNYAAY